MMTLDTNIIAAAMLVEQAKENFEAKLKAVQDECQHLVVVQSPPSSRDGNWRVCVACRLKERGSTWSYRFDSWSRHNYETAILDNQDGRMIIQNPMSDHDFWENYLKPLI